MKSAKPKKGTKDVAIEFKCLKCGKDIQASTSSYSNLRRHVDRMHSSVIKEFDTLWAKNKTRKRYHEEAEEGMEGTSKSPKQSKIGNYFGGPKALARQESSVVTQENIDDAIVAFVVGCNAPFRVVKAPEFRDLVLLGKSSHSLVKN